MKYFANKLFSKPFHRLSLLRKIQFKVNPEYGFFRVDLIITPVKLLSHKSLAFKIAKINQVRNHGR